MKQQLVELGVEEEKIIHFFDLHKIPEIRNTRKPVCYYGGAEELILKPDTDRKKIVLLSQDMTLGPAGNFSAFSPLSKLVLSLCMIIGRLEIFPILVMFSRSTWRRV